VINQLMDNFHVLSGILIEKCSFQVLHLVNSMQSQAWSTNWHSAIDRSIAIDLLAIPGVQHWFKRCRNLSTKNSIAISVKTQTLTTA